MGPTKKPIAQRFAGLVLAGGRSLRFGREKALAPFLGRPLLAWSLTALEGCCDAVAVSATPGGGAAARAAAAGYPVVVDDPARPTGPLTGLTAGLAWALQGGFDAVITLPCDTPGVRTDHLRRLASELEAAPAAFAETVEGPHGLCAVWRVDLLEDLSRRLDAGDHPAIQRFLAEIGARPVSFADSAAFANFNTPDALHEAELKS